MLDYNTTGACVLVLTLATIFVIIPLTLRAQRSEKGVGIWLLSGLTGILLGVGGAAAAVQLMGYNLTPKRAILSADFYANEETVGDAGEGEAGDTLEHAADPPAESPGDMAAEEAPAATD